MLISTILQLHSNLILSSLAAFTAFTAAGAHSRSEQNTQPAQPTQQTTVRPTKPRSRNESLFEVEDVLSLDSASAKDAVENNENEDEVSVESSHCWVDGQLTIISIISRSFYVPILLRLHMKISWTDSLDIPLIFPLLNPMDSYEHVENTCK